MNETFATFDMNAIVYGKRDYARSLRHAFTYGFWDAPHRFFNYIGWPLIAMLGGLCLFFLMIFVFVFEYPIMLVATLFGKFCVKTPKFTKSIPTRKPDEK